MHANAQIILKICLRNKNFIGSLGLKFEKDSFWGCGEIQILLALSVYLLVFFVFSPNVKKFAKMCVAQGWYAILQSGKYTSLDPIPYFSF